MFSIVPALFDIAGRKHLHHISLSPMNTAVRRRVSCRYTDTIHLRYGADRKHSHLQFPSSPRGRSLSQIHNIARDLLSSPTWFIRLLIHVTKPDNAISHSSPFYRPLPVGASSSFSAAEVPASTGVSPRAIGGAAGRQGSPPQRPRAARRP